VAATRDNCPPNLDDLMAGFLARRGAAEPGDHPETCDVEAYESVPAASVDPRLAFDAAVSVLAERQTNVAKKLPNGWSNLVASLESLTGVPMAAGNYPQAVRDLLPLVRAGSLSATMAAGRTPVDDAGLLFWAEACARGNDPVLWLLAAGVLRLAGHYDEAGAILADKAGAISADWQPAWANEQAALAWHRGDRAAAAAAWAAMPESTSVLFNRGMAELFSDRPESARGLLRSAVEGLDESSPWHHLGRLYLALAESR